MAASPGNVYQKMAAFKKKHTMPNLVPSSGAVSAKLDKYLKRERDIPLTAKPPPSPPINRSANVSRFSQISMNSDSSDDLDGDPTSNSIPARPKRQQVRYDFL